MDRVLILIKGLGRGGAEQLLLNAAAYLDRSRFSYEIAYILPWKDALVPELEAAGFPVHCLDGVQRARWVGRLGDLLRDHDIDLVHVHSPYVAIGTRLLLARQKRPRLVYTEHNVWERYHRATYWGNLLTYPRNDHVFAVSEHAGASVRYPRPLRWRRMPPVETLYHGPDPAAVAGWGPSEGVREEFGIEDDALVVGTVANFKAHKGYPVLIRAAARVRRQVPNVRFVLVGQGPLEPEIRRKVWELGLSETVIFAGYRSDVPRVASMFDVFVLASRQEGLAIALIEAMALGKPAVVTNAGGLPEVVDHFGQGLVVPTNDDRSLAHGILTLLGDPALRRRLGEAARVRSADFDIRNAVRRMEAVYGDLLG